MRRAVPVVCLLAVSVAPVAAQLRTIGGCTMFPANNVWNTAIDKLPVSTNSAAYVNTIGATAHLFPDFWSDAGGLFLNIVSASQPRVPVTVFYSGEADPGPFPIPADALVQQASDAHLLVLDQGNCKLYEMWSAAKQADGSWSVGSAAVFDLSSNTQRPLTWTSANAAGTSIMAGTVTYDEVMAGAINHAIAMTVPQTQNSYIWPATHQASTLSGSQYPPMGQRFRLKAGFDVSPYPFEVRVILNALKKYGAIVTDNGAAWFLTGLRDSRWNNDNLHTITQVLGSNMEAVDESSLIVTRNSAEVAGSALALDGVYLDRRQGGAGTVVSGQVILTAAAPSGGAVVALSSSTPGALTMPASVTVPTGAVIAPFTATINSQVSTTPVFVRASYNGMTKTSAELFVTGSSGKAAPMLSAFSISPASATSGTTVTATITLTSTAPPGGTVVALSSSNTAAVPVPSTVTVPAGLATAMTAISTVAQSSATSANVTAALNGEGLTVPLSLSEGYGTTGNSTVRINAGGPAYTDSGGTVWGTDSSFSGGSSWSTQSAIAGTTTPALYQTCRWGAFTYTSAVPNGTYNVTLKFAEISAYGAGQRQFDVAINGAKVLSNFDIFAQAGWLTAVDKTFPLTVSNGGIVIQFSRGAANWPLVSAIQIVPATAAAFTPIRVNASGAAYTDPAGNVWAGDNGYSGGNTWSVTSAISGTTTPALYQSCRWGAFSYNFAVPNGNYTVNLKFAEVSLDGPGRRVFNVAINGTAVLSNFDIFAEAGWLKALDKSFPITVVNGQVAIQFTQGSADWPLVSAIEIVPR